MSGFNACSEGRRDGRRLVRKMEGGRVGKRVFNSKDFISIPQPKELWQSERGPGSSGLALIQSRVPAPVTTTAAPAAEPRVPHACPPGTAPPQPDLSTWLTLPSRGFQGRGKGSPRTFSFSLTELPPSSVFCYKIQNSGPILTTYFWGHKSTSPLFCFSKKIIISELASRLPNFSSSFSLVCIFKAGIQWAHVESFCSQSGNLSFLVDLVSLQSSQFGVALLLQMMSMKIILSGRTKWSGLLKRHRSH